MCEIKLITGVAVLAIIIVTIVGIYIQIKFANKRK